MNYKIKDMKKELIETLLSMDVGDTAEVDYTLSNVARVRAATSIINKSHTVTGGNKRFRTSTFRKELGVIDINRIE